MFSHEDFVDTCLGSEHARAAWLAQRLAHRNRAFVGGMLCGLTAVGIAHLAPETAIIALFVCVTSLGIALQANFDIRLLTLGAALARKALPSAAEGS